MLLTAQLGIVFLVLGFAAMFLMYHLWGYPFDKATRTSAAPRWAMLLHRIVGYLFGITYVLIMWHMVPRLWQYQIEFPARTTAHILLGITVGFLLIVKISIIRFFRHFEEWMPYLGTAIMLCTLLLLGLSLPFVLQERSLAAQAPGGDVFGETSRARVAEKLPHAGLPKEAPLDELSSERSLRRGRQVLLNHCVKCHDLKTILARPRTAQGWWQTVLRMAEKPALFRPISERDQWRVTAYMIAITPDLQKSVKRVREAAEARDEAIEEAMGEPVAAAGEDGADQTADEAGAEPGAGEAAAPAKTAAPATDAVAGSPPRPHKPAGPPIDPQKAQASYQETCSQCHELSDVDQNPPRSRRAAERLIRRMIKDNDADLTPEQIRLCTFWLDYHFVQKKS